MSLISPPNTASTGSSLEWVPDPLGWEPAGILGISYSQWREIRILFPPDACPVPASDCEPIGDIYLCPFRISVRKISTMPALLQSNIDDLPEICLGSMAAPVLREMAQEMVRNFYRGAGIVKELRDINPAEVMRRSAPDSIMPAELLFWTWIQGIDFALEYQCQLMRVVPARAISGNSDSSREIRDWLTMLGHDGVNCDALTMTVSAISRSIDERFADPPDVVIDAAYDFSTGLARTGAVRGLTDGPPVTPATDLTREVYFRGQLPTRTTLPTANDFNDIFVNDWNNFGSYRVARWAYTAALFERWSYHG